MNRNKTTDTNQASELFELCKRVYELFPFWAGTDMIYGKEQDGNWKIMPLTLSIPKRDRIPLYTSDYLLEKLPSSIESKEYPGKRAVLWTRKEDDHLDKYPEGRVTYFAWYFVTGVVDGVSDFGVHADTPLKALLRLTIALSEAGELK